MTNTTSSDAPYHLDLEMARPKGTRMNRAGRDKPGEVPIESSSSPQKQLPVVHQNRCLGRGGGCCCGLSVACILCFGIPAALLLIGYLYLRRQAANDGQTVSSYMQQYANGAGNDGTVSNYVSQWWAGNNNHNQGGRW